MSLFQEPDKIFGDPDTDSQMFPGQQSFPDTCAIRCQEHILELFTGKDYDERELVREAYENGWYSPNYGTAPEDVGKILELHGIAVNQYHDANIFNLANELAQGHKVIIGVDSSELWEGKTALNEMRDAAGISNPDHAVNVSGIDTTDPDNIKVIISDPGTGAAAATYPLGEFLDAWKDSDFFLVATQQPAPPWINEMVNFDYTRGHIPTVGSIAYDDLQGYVDNPNPSSDIFFIFNPADDVMSSEIISKGSISPTKGDEEDPRTDEHPDDSMVDHSEVSFGGYYNADGTYHYESDNTDRDPETGKIVHWN